jgi:hypothetical protein
MMPLASGAVASALSSKVKLGCGWQLRAGRRWGIYLARHSPTKSIGTIESVDADAAIAEAAKLFDVKEPRKLIAVRRR